MMRIKNIRINGGTQSRAEIDQLTVSDYAEAMKDAGVTHYPEALVVVRQARAAIAKVRGE